MTSIEPPDVMPRSTNFDEALVEQEGREAFDAGKALDSYSYLPGTAPANAFVRGWLQAHQESSDKYPKPSA